MYLQIIFFLLMLFSLFEVLKSKGRGIKIFSVFLFIFYLMSFLRWERGTDWAAYYTLYENPFALGDEAYEITYYALSFFFSQILNADYTVFLFVQASILYYFVYKGIVKECYYPVLALFCIYTLIGNGGIFFVRITIATAIIFYSFRFIKERHLLKFILFILFASCFHRASIVVLPAYFVYALRLSHKQIFLLLILSIASLVILKTSFFEVFMTKFVSYKESSSQEIEQKQYLMGVANKLFLLVIFWFFRNSTEENKGLLKIYIFNMFIYIYFGNINITLARIANFYNIFQVYQICNIVYYAKTPKVKLHFYWIIAFLFAIRSLMSVTEYKNLFTPYKSIFNKELPVEVG